MTGTFSAYFCRPITAEYALELLVFLPLQAWFSDRYGRVKSLYNRILLSIAGTADQTAAQNETSFNIGRFLVGASATWFVSAIVLITEIPYPPHRKTCTALYNYQFCEYHSRKKRPFIFNMPTLIRGASSWLGLKRGTSHDRLMSMEISISALGCHSIVDYRLHWPFQSHPFGSYRKISLKKPVM